MSHEHRRAPPSTAWFGRLLDQTLIAIARYELSAVASCRSVSVSEHDLAGPGLVEGHRGLARPSVPGHVVGGDGSPVGVEGLGSVPWNSGRCYVAVMKKRGPVEFPGRLTGEVILYSDHYDLNEKAEQHRREKETVGRRLWWRLWRRRPSAS